MAEIGIRELRDGLSKHLARVKRGETLTVTEHGQPVARIIPTGIPADLAQLAAEGRITLPTKARTSVRRPTIRATAGPPLSDYISEDRG